MHKSFYSLGILLAGLIAQPTHADVLDSIQFGNRSSESAHELKAEDSEIFEGALGLQARRLLPKEQTNWRGGNMTFEMAVDPDKPNYITTKFWGGYYEKDKKPNRLMLFIDGKQVGQRHLGEIEQLDIANTKPRYIGRFYYKTMPLPLHMTKGKNTVNLAIETQGHVNGYGGKSFDTFQEDVEVASRGLYRIYSHTDSFFVPDETETQGAAVAAPPIRSVNDEATMDRVKKRINDTLADLMKRDDGRYSQYQLTFMARAYNEPWTDAYQSSEVIEKVAKGVDYQYREFAAGKINLRGSKWWAGMGLTADAVRILQNELASYLNKPVTGDSIRRKNAWAKMFVDCRDDRIVARRAYTNQSMILDTFGIYLCNRALQAIRSNKAWPEKKALTVMYESVGLDTWKGSWTSPNGKPKYPYGKNYRIFTEAGLSRELGYVGGYGEVIDWACKLYDSTRSAYGKEGDPQIKERLRKIAKARAYFRYPGIDKNGDRAMRLENNIGWRDWKFPGDVVYDQVASRESIPFEAAVMTMDPELLGYAQHMLEDNQYFQALEKIMQDDRIQATLALLGAPHTYETVLKQPTLKTRLPMAIGQPDSVFADPGTGAVALKNGEDVIYVSLYWRARYAVNSLARIHHMTPTMERDATVWQKTKLNDSGKIFDVPDTLNAPFNGKLERDYRDGGLGQNLAEAGIKQPVAIVPDEFEDYKLGKENAYAGKGDFYELEYGNYLFLMNCTDKKTFDFDIPEQFTNAKDLVSGFTPKIRTIHIRPQQTVVLYKASDEELKSKVVEAILASEPKLEAQAGEITANREVVYKTIGDVELKLHIFEPEGHKETDQRPAIVFFFGGGWSGGNPKQFYQQARALANQGMVAYSAEYRVKSRNKTTPFECVKDAKSAVRWIRTHASELGIDPNRIVASGGSAGGHIAGATGIIKGYEEAGEDLSVSSKPNLMILFNPVLDTTDKGYGAKNFKPEQQTDLSLTHKVKPGIVPTLVFHGTGDTTVPFENAERFTRLMKKAGNECLLEAYKSKGHGFFNGAFFRKRNGDEDFNATMQQSIQFLTKHDYLNPLK